MHQMMLHRLNRQYSEKLGHMIHLICQLIYFLHRVDQPDMLHSFCQLFQCRLEVVLCFFLSFDPNFVSSCLLLHSGLVHAGHSDVAGLGLVCVDLSILSLLNIRRHRICPYFIQIVQHA